MAELNPFRYRGYYYDNETGFYFLQSRYYNPEWRRFINPDTYFIAGEDVLNGSNMYAYCNGNPVMYKDPSGTGIKEIFDKIGEFFLNIVRFIIATPFMFTIFMGQESTQDTLGGFIDLLGHWDWVIPAIGSLFAEDGTMAKLFAGAGELFAGVGSIGEIGSLFGRAINGLLGLFGLGQTKPGNGFEFLSDAEYGVKFGTSGGSSSAPMSVLQAPGTNPIVLSVDQVNLLRDYNVDPVYIAIDHSATPGNAPEIPFDNIRWEKRDLATGNVDAKQDKLELISYDEGNFTKHNTTVILSYATVEAKQECSYMVRAIGTKDGKDVSGYDGEVPVIVSKLLVENPNNPRQTGQFCGVPTVADGGAYERPGKTSDKTLADLVYKGSSFYNTKTTYLTKAMGEIKYKGTDYYMVDTSQVANKVMYVKQEEFSRIVWPITLDTTTTGTDHINSYYGFRDYNSKAKSHHGIDTPSGKKDTNPVVGVPVYAIMDGTVWHIQTDYSGDGRGIYVVLEHKIAGGYTYYTEYQHLASVSNSLAKYDPIKDNDSGKVKAGQPIATAGDTGSSGSLHLHYQVHRGAPGSTSNPNANTINPIGIYHNWDMRGNKGYTTINYMFVYESNPSAWKFNPGFDWTFGKTDIASKSSDQKKYEKYFTGLDIDLAHNYRTDSSGNVIVSSATAKKENLFSKDNTTKQNWVQDENKGGWSDYNPY